MADCFSPSAFRITARFSRSAFISFSMASTMLRGGSMFLTSTRFTLMPHLSVAVSRIEVIWRLISSRLVRVWSKVMEPIIFLKVVAERFSIAAIGRSTP